MSRTVTLNNIQPRQNSQMSDEELEKRRRWSDFHAIVKIGESIRIYGAYCGNEFDRTFKLGDNAEYGNNNLSYFGPIQSISDKCIFIRDSFYTDRVKRIDLYTFIWRNYNFDVEETKARNAAMRPHLRGD